MFPWKRNCTFALQCCRATEYFILLPAVQRYISLHVKCLPFCPILNKLGYSRHFNETLQYQIDSGHSSGSQVDTFGHTDVHDEANRRLLMGVYSLCIRTRLKADVLSWPVSLAKCYTFGVFMCGYHQTDIYIYN